ncbi:hypothetical protein HPB50_008221 [Hyalomma asiaticum]|uniref:Uncharacterized protein n=1 Tax=Hyalomma asiaticum TaxID=266040 RepID=A0ACB7S122_HYAAI|nr:hypothetical protein HPB50_008221 [Hyalomma asiaticum]
MQRWRFWQLERCSRHPSRIQVHYRSGEEDDDDLQRYLPLCLVVTCLLLLIVIFIVVNMVTDSSDDSDGADAKRDVYKKGGGNSDEAMAESAPEQAPKPSSTHVQTPTQSAASYAERENPTRPLTCVYGEKLTSAQRFPEDGLCDFALYSSLFNYDIHTHYKALLTLWSDRIFHYGVIDIYPYLSYVNDQRNLELKIKKFWPNLQFAVDHLKSVITPQQPSYSFFGLAASSESWMKEIERLTRNVYEINYIIFRGDYFPFNDDVPSTCITTGPTHVNGFLSLLGYSLESAHHYAELIQGSKVNATPSISVTAAGLYALTSVSGTTGELAGEVCGSLPLANRSRGITEFCQNPDYRIHYDSKHNVVFLAAHSIFSSYSLGYDNKESLRYKLCSLKANYTTVHYGIAVFGLDLADWENKCGSGNYSRLRFVRDLLNYFRFHFFSPGDMTGCLKL